MHSFKTPFNFRFLAIIAYEFWLHEYVNELLEGSYCQIQLYGAVLGAGKKITML